MLLKLYSKVIPMFLITDSYKQYYLYRGNMLHSTTKALATRFHAKAMAHDAIDYHLRQHPEDTTIYTVECE